MADYQWYPGHMTKARRMMQENIRLVDLVIEVIDARVPLASRNPDIDSLAKGKARIIIMNKADLADPEATKEFTRAFESKGMTVLALDSREKNAAQRVKKAVLSACSEKIRHDQQRGMGGRPIRAMVCGIPNVGKSTLINSLAGRASAKTGDRPGVTKGKQWITVALSQPVKKPPRSAYAPGNPMGYRSAQTMNLLDTPGILWPKFEDRQIGVLLALVGSIRDEVLDEQELAVELLKILCRRYPDLLHRRYDTPEHPLQFGMAVAETPAGEAQDLQKRNNGGSDNVQDSEAGYPGHAVRSEAPTDGKDLRENSSGMNLAPGGSREDSAMYELLRQIAANRRLLAAGEKLDLPRAAHVLLDDYRSGRIGRITLDEV